MATKSTPPATSIQTLEATLETALTGRPAETGGAAAAIGTLIALAAGERDPAVIGALVGVVGLVPAAITAIVNAGGILGALRRLWRGRS